MDQQLFRGYDRHLNVARDEGATVETLTGRGGIPMVEIKIYEHPKRASAFLPLATARALAQEILRAIENTDG
jgi:hypothetical protein